MNRKNKITILILTAAFLALAGGYFATSRFGLFQKKTTNYSQVATETSISQSVNQSDQVSNQDQVVNNQETINQETQQTDSSLSSDTLVNQPKNLNPTNQVENKNSKPQDDSGNSKNTGKIINKFVSWGFTKAADRKIDTVIVHTSYDAIGNDPYNVDGIIAEWKAAGVSPHYMIARDGTIYQLVDDKNIAYHAGVSKMPDGRTNVNDFSIGIEMVNTKDGKFTSQQYDSLNYLINVLKNKYSIKYILGHDDIAPGRKTDPWGMDWSKVKR